MSYTSFNRYRFEIILSLMLALSIIARVWQITGLSEDYDEGAHLMQAWLLSQGYELYGEIFFPLPPLLLQPLAWLFKLTGPSSLAARLFELFWAGVGLVALAYLGRKLWPEKVVLLAVANLSLADNYFRLSRISLGNIPALACGLVALCAGVYYLERGRYGWLGLAGLAAAISLLIKPLAITIPILLGGLIIARHYRDPLRISQVAKAGLILGTGLLIPFLIVFLIYEPGPMLEQVVYLRYRSGQMENDGFGDNLHLMYEYITDNPGLVGLSIFGLVLICFSTQRLLPTWKQGKVGKWLILGWLGLTLISLFGFESLHSHHLIVLEPILALLAALAILYTIGSIKRPYRPDFMGLLGSAALLLYLFTLPALLDDRFSDKPRGVEFSETKPQWEAVKHLQQVSSPADFVISDDLAIPFEAGRKTPPRLSDPSRIVIQSGYVTDELAIQSASQDQVQAVILWTDRFRERLPRFAAWAETNFRQSAAFGEDKIIYFDPRSEQSAESP